MDKPVKDGTLLDNGGSRGSMWPANDITLMWLYFPNVYIFVGSSRARKPAFSNNILKLLYLSFWSDFCPT